METVVARARGGRSRVVQLSLSDYSNVPHRIRYFITTENFGSTLAQSGVSTPGLTATRFNALNASTNVWADGTFRLRIAVEVDGFRDGMDAALSPDCHVDRGGILPTRESG